MLTAYNFSMHYSAIYEAIPVVQMDALIEQASKAGMGVVAMKVMAGGRRWLKPTDSRSPKLKPVGGAGIWADMPICLRGRTLLSWLPPCRRHAR